MVGKNILENSELQEHEFFAPASSDVNLLNYLIVLNYIKDVEPDLVIHCAGVVGGIQANIKNPVKYLVDNMDMGRNIVMASKEAGVKKLINFGSSCMYPRNKDSGLTEDLILTAELEPTNEGYALAKIVTARLCDYINREDSDYHYKTVIPCNLYGRWDKFSPKNSHMIPAAIKKIDDAKRSGDSSIEIWGDGEARREFMLASEVADFIAYVLPKFDKMPTYINIGLGHDYTINEYYQAIANVVGYDGKFEHDLSKPVGMKRKLSDVSLQKNLGWASKVSLEEGLKQTYQFYLDRRDQYAN